MVRRNFRKNSFEDKTGMSRKRHDDPPGGIYEKDNDSGRRKRGVQGPQLLTLTFDVPSSYPDGDKA